jgi:hypothetical protein
LAFRRFPRFQWLFEASVDVTDARNAAGWPDRDLFVLDRSTHL